MTFYYLHALKGCNLNDKEDWAIPEKNPYRRWVKVEDMEFSPEVLKIRHIKIKKPFVHFILENIFDTYQKYF